MGLLDWLQTAIGSDFSGASTPPGGGPGEAVPSIGSQLPPAPPPAAPPMPPRGANETPISVPAPSIPLPQPRPNIAAGNATPITIPAPTPAAAPGPLASTTPPPAPSVTPAQVRNTPPAPDSNSGLSIIGRSLGLNRNTDKEARGSLGSGLSAVANNWNKPALAAFAGGAGAALEGGSKAQDKTIEQQHQALADAISAVKVGDQRALLKAQTEMDLAYAKNAMEGKGGKDSVINSEQQLYVRAVEMANKDQSLAGLRYQVQRAAQGGDPTEIKQAQEALTKAYEERIRQHAQALGLDPKKIDKLGKQAGMSKDNPIPHTQMNSQKAYDDLPPGTWFVNPKDKQVLQKPMTPAAPAQGAPAQPPAAAAPAAPPPVAPSPPPTPPAAPVRSAAAQKDDEDDEE